MIRCPLEKLILKIKKLDNEDQKANNNKLDYNDNGEVSLFADPTFILSQALD